MTDGNVGATSHGQFSLDAARFSEVYPIAQRHGNRTGARTGRTRRGAASVLRNPCSVVEIRPQE
jgi:hypothetical protein